METDYISMGENRLFEFWYRHAASLGYSPEDYALILPILSAGQEAYLQHLSYRQQHNLSVLSEAEYLRFFVMNAPTAMGEALV